MTGHNFRDQLSRHLPTTGNSPSRLLVVGEPPAELLADCMDTLGSATHRAELTSAGLGERGDVVLDASRTGAADRIELFKQHAASMANGARYIVFTGEGDAADSATALRSYFCDCLDDLHGYHKRGRKVDGFGVTSLTRRINSVNFYPELVIIEIQDREKPEMLNAGEPQF